MANYVPLKEAKKRLGLSGNTLRRYADEGKIDVIKTEGRQRRFNVEGYLSRHGAGQTICYARVSSSHQRDDLARQRHYLSERFENAEIISDIGSGLNFKRKGLRTILDKLMHGDKLTIIVAHKDRLARFGYELIEYMVQQNGGSIVVLERTEHSPQQELVEDILAILTVFGARVNGLRRYHKKVEEDTSLFEQNANKDG